MSRAPHSLSVLRLEPAAHLPTQAHPGDLGWDLYALEGGTIEAGALARLRTGIAVAFPAGVGAVVKDRSSLAVRGLHTLAGVIDPGYRGEILVVVANLGPSAITLAPGDRCAQLLLFAGLPATVTEVAELPDTTRGTGGFGSSGR